MERAIEVQRLVIPFTITANASPASKSLATDEASVLFLQTENKTQINSTSGALSPGENAPTFDLTATDASGDFNLLVNVAPGDDVTGDHPVKIMQAQVIDRITGVAYPCYPNSSNPDIDTVGTKMLLNCHSSVDLATTDMDACLSIEYTVHE